MMRVEGRAVVKANLFCVSVSRLLSLFLSLSFPFSDCCYSLVFSHTIARKST